MCVCMYMYIKVTISKKQYSHVHLPRSLSTLQGRKKSLLLVDCHATWHECYTCINVHTGEGTNRSYALKHMMYLHASPFAGYLSKEYRCPSVGQQGYLSTLGAAVTLLQRCPMLLYHQSQWLLGCPLGKSVYIHMQVKILTAPTHLNTRCSPLQVNYQKECIYCRCPTVEHKDF